MSKAKILGQRGEEFVKYITFDRKAGGKLTFHLSDGDVCVVSNKSFRAALDKVVSLVAPVSHSADDLLAGRPKRPVGRQVTSKCKTR